jgi:hypothetical protein
MSSSVGRPLCNWVLLLEHTTNAAVAANPLAPLPPDTGALLTAVQSWQQCLHRLRGDGEADVLSRA